MSEEEKIFIKYLLAIDLMNRKKLHDYQNPVTKEDNLNILEFRKNKLLNGQNPPLVLIGLGSGPI